MRSSVDLIQRLKEFSPGRVQAQVSGQHLSEIETLKAKLEAEKNLRKQLENAVTQLYFTNPQPESPCV